MLPLLVLMGTSFSPDPVVEISGHGMTAQPLLGCYKLSKF